MLNLIKGQPSQQMWSGVSQSVIAEILAALRQKRPLRITYCAAEASVPSINTKLSSYRLTSRRGQWYLVGRSSWHRKIVRFEMKYIRHAEQTEHIPDAAD